MHAVQGQVRQQDRLLYSDLQLALGFLRGRAGSKTLADIYPCSPIGEVALSSSPPCPPLAQHQHLRAHQPGAAAASRRALDSFDNASPAHVTLSLSSVRQRSKGEDIGLPSIDSAVDEMPQWC